MNAVPATMAAAIDTLLRAAGGEQHPGSAPAP